MKKFIRILFLLSLVEHIFGSRCIKMYFGCAFLNNDSTYHCDKASCIHQKICEYANYTDCTNCSQCYISDTNKYVCEQKQDSNKCEKIEICSGV